MSDRQPSVQDKSRESAPKIPEKDSDAIEDEIKSRTELRLLGQWFRSRLVAGLVCVAMAAVLGYMRSLEFPGWDHATLLAGLIFSAGFLIGERIVFTLLGVIIGAYFLAEQCAPPV